MRVRIDPRKLREITEHVAAMGDRLSDLTAPLMGGARRAREDTKQDFATGGSISGEPWPELSPGTLKRDRYHDAHSPARPTTSHRPLSFSERFRNSVRAWADAFTAGISLGPAYYLNFFGTTAPDSYVVLGKTKKGGKVKVGGLLKNPPREAGYISRETIDWTVNAILTYVIDNSNTT